MAKALSHNLGSSSSAVFDKEGDSLRWHGIREPVLVDPDQIAEFHAFTGKRAIGPVFGAAKWEDMDRETMAHRDEINEQNHQ